jgi:hypothetical protein
VWLSVEAFQLWRKRNHMALLVRALFCPCFLRPTRSGKCEPGHWNKTLAPFFFVSKMLFPAPRGSTKNRARHVGSRETAYPGTETPGWAKGTVAYVGPHAAFFSPFLLSQETVFQAQRRRSFSESSRSSPRKIKKKEDAQPASAPAAQPATQPAAQPAAPPSLNPRWSSGKILGTPVTNDKWSR